MHVALWYLCYHYSVLQDILFVYQLDSALISKGRIRHLICTVATHSMGNLL